MPGKLFNMIVRNVFRSPARLMITLAACAVAASVVCFFTAAEQSLSRTAGAAGDDTILIVRQKDRY